VGKILQIRRSGGAASDTPEDAAGREAGLVERARGGDVDAWSCLYQEHFHRVFRHAAYLVGDTSAAEDLVQETFARAFVGLAQFEGRSTLQAWLRGIAVNLVRKHWRSRYRGDQAMARLELAARQPPASSQDPEGAHLRQRRAEVLLAVLETLPPPLREAFVLCDLEDVPIQQAAAELGISPGNLRVRATRARARIRSELTRLGWLSEASGEGGGDHGDP